MKLFTLQVNSSGSWATVLRFPPERLEKVKLHLRPLAALTGWKAVWRIIDIDKIVVGYCDAPDYFWRAPQ